MYVFPSMAIVGVTILSQLLDIQTMTMDVSLVKEGLGVCLEI